MINSAGSLALFPLRNFMRSAWPFALVAFEKYSRSCVRLVLLTSLRPVESKVAVYHPLAGIAPNMPTLVEEFIIL